MIEAIQAIIQNMLDKNDLNFEQHAELVAISNRLYELEFLLNEQLQQEAI